MPRKRTQSKNEKSREEKETPKKEIKSLGILFVHGIGTQQRGDTLAHCGTTIHRWMQKWFKPITDEGVKNSIELLDTSLVQSQGNDPAHSRLIFRNEKRIAAVSWLLAESCWAETFRPPKYSEFVRWAFRAFPSTVLLHLVESYRRFFRVIKTAGNVLKNRYATHEEMILLQRDIGIKSGSLPSQPDALGKLISSKAGLATFGWLAYTILLLPLLFAAILLLAILFTIMIIGMLPIGFIRSFTGWVQKKVAAVLGDSYLFLTNPIAASAAITQVKRDLNWLHTQQCDRIVILAHSQGAAIAHRAIEELSWEGGELFSKLYRLITYGSGLQKLSDLKQLFGDISLRNTIYKRMAVVFIALGAICIMTFPFLPPALSFSGGFVFQLFALIILAENFEWSNPALPSGVDWKNFYASHDPISNGPIVINPSEVGPSGNPARDAAFGITPKMHVDLFYIHSQHKVINMQSTIADHNTYWFANDDFVRRVGMELLNASEIESPATPDAEWADVSAERRRWRVGLRAKCRNIGILAGLVIVFWPFKFFAKLGENVSAAFPWIKEALTAKWIPNWFRNYRIPASLLGRAALLVCLCFMAAIALTGWKMWERREIAYFFRRQSFRAAGFGMTVFALGWLGILMVTPVTVALSLGWQASWPAMWIFSFLLIFSCWKVMRSGKGPGRFSTWIPMLLERGEYFLEQETGDLSENMDKAKGYFYWAIRWLSKKHPKEWIRALLGMAKAQEQMKKLSEMTEAEIKALRDFYTEALSCLETRGEDTREVRQRLDRLPGEKASTEAPKQHDG